MQAYLWIGIGSAFGGMARHWCNGLIMRLAGAGFPYGILTINVLGSLVIGFAAAAMGSEGRWPSSPTAQQFVLVGICGGYTTFSSFSLNTLNLIQGNQWGAAAANVLFSVALCLVAVWLGHAAGVALNPPS
ncbi:MAG: fluoride efflux transporter CrcB [Rhodospirillaceae bacterium]|nr:MAG: fluoride efflux transporter CrcB [Rhodospirillaceae bacterium]